MSVWTVSLDVEVSDPQELWDAARDYLTAEHAGDLLDIIGSREEPDIGACLQMLLDRSEHLQGAEIAESRSCELQEQDHDR